jgi:hypothetical protein
MERKFLGKICQILPQVAAEIDAKSSAEMDALRLKAAAVFKQLASFGF